VFRRRRGGGGREGDIGLADVAVAVLGPVAFLWIVFQGFAAFNSQQGCDEIGETEASARVEQIKAWYEGERREIERLDRDLQSCGSVPPFARSVRDRARARS